MNEFVKKARYTLWAEILFNILPLLIVTVLSLSSADNDFVGAKDILFVAIILFGQSIVKFSAGVSNSKNKFNWQYVSFIVTLVIVLGLVPSSILLASLYPKDNLNGWKNLFIGIEAVLSIVSFFVVGLMGQTWLERKDEAM